MGTLIPSLPTAPITQVSLCRHPAHTAISGTELRQKQAFPGLRFGAFVLTPGASPSLGIDQGLSWLSLVPDAVQLQEKHQSTLNEGFVSRVMGGSTSFLAFLCASHEVKGFVMLQFAPPGEQPCERGRWLDSEALLDTDGSHCSVSPRDG